MKYRVTAMGTVVPPVTFVKSRKVDYAKLR